MKALIHASQICYSSRETLMFTFEMAQKYKDHPGCYLEAGVAAGAQIIAMALAAPNKQIYAFDSYIGIPLCSNRDDQMPGIAMLTTAEQKALPDPGKQVLMSSGATVVSEEDFWINIHASIGKQHNIKTIKGWFEETVQDFKEPIALLRLDGDLYNSTFVCLLHLFPRLIEGGCLIIDDWELPGCRDACREYFELISYEPDWQSVSNIKFLIK